MKRVFYVLVPALLLASAFVYRRWIATVPVEQAPVERGDVVQEVFGRGTIESRREAELGFDLVGRISEIRVDEGDHVKLGQILASLAPEQFSADLRSGSTGVSLARAAIGRLEADQRRAAAAARFA